MTKAAGTRTYFVPFLSLQYMLFVFLTETRNKVSISVLPFLLQPPPKRGVKSGRIGRMTVLSMLFMEIKVQRQILCFFHTC